MSALSSTSSTDLTPPHGGNSDIIAMARANWLPLAALLLLIVPTLISNGREIWSTEAGAHGPIVLVTGLWLLHTSWPEMALRRTTPPPMWMMILLLVPVVVAYVLGRALDLLFVESSAAVAMAFLLVLQRAGAGVFISRPFPFIYLAMLIPIPGWIMDGATMGLQHLISSAATFLLASLDYPVLREGVVIYVAHYQLLVEDACSGMNSLFGLVAISLFYIYLLHRADWRHAAMLLAAILPIAIFVNLIRVLALILITYHFGDAVAQGFVHNFAGIVLFAFSLSLMVLVDYLIRRVRGQTEVAA
ncbi:MAG: exosortase [Sphingopyxis sp.]|nr:exosortase [Sphingopyxis sp.]